MNKVNTAFLQQGSSFMVRSRESLNYTETLPAGNYIVKQNPQNGELYLDRVEDFNRPSKIYGNTVSRAHRIINTFLDRPNATGVLLNGDKGSGKTLLVKEVAMLAAEQHSIPTIIINQPWRGDAFNQFIQSITQPAIVLFDEFEKVYDREEQEEVLTLLDGVFPAKKLFMLTVNDKWRVDQHMQNRPGRIFYLLEYSGLDAAFVREYCEDNLRNKNWIDEMILIHGTFHSFNFDMLKAIVEESNRYNESPRVCTEMLNASPAFERGGSGSWVVSVAIDGVSNKIRTYPSDINFNPVSVDVFNLDCYYSRNTRPQPVLANGIAVVAEDDDDDNEINVELALAPSDIVKINAEGIVYRKGNATVRVTRKDNYSFNFSAL